MHDEEREPQETEDGVVITLTAEDGSEHEFTIVQVIAVDGKDYAVLYPLHDEEEDKGAVILRIDQENGEDVLVEIDDEEEFDRVAEAWEDLLDEEDEVDEDEVQ